jgi:hypothetical protein
MTYDDEPRGKIAPKKGITKLRELIAERKGQGSDSGAWQPATSQRLDFRGFTAKLVTPDDRTDIQRRADEWHDTIKGLSNELALDLLSVRVQARDRKRRGKVVECWIRGQLLRRIIERVSPNRHGINTAKYSVAIALLCKEGIAEPLPSGANGYQWTADYQRIGQRAGWLVDYVKTKGEMRKLSGPQRYDVFE